MTFPNATTGTEKLTREVQSLRWELDEVSDKTDQHGRRLDDLGGDYRLEQLRTDLDAIQERADALGDDLKEVRTELARLAGQVRWLEHHVRAQQGLEPIDLHDVPAAVTKLAARTRAGEQARGSLLPDGERTRLSGRINRYNAVLEQAQGHLAEALQLSKTLATTSPGSEEHTAAATAFRAARTEAMRQYDIVRRLQPETAEARAALDADDERRRDLGPQIMSGEHARAALQTRLRERIGQAVRRRELFPVWFTTVLGYGPPADHPDQWARLAADVLAYRLIWQVDDPVAALGDTPPFDAAHTSQRLERADLTKRLARLRICPRGLRTGQACRSIGMLR